MGSKKRRSKVKFAGQETKARRAEELRALFNDNAPTSSGFADQTQTQKSFGAGTQVTAATMLTPTPTPTLPTQATDVTKTEATQIRRYERTQTFAGAPLDQTTTGTSSRPPLRTVISAHPYTPAKRVDLGARDRDRKTDWWLGPALIFAAVVMLGLGWLHIERARLVDHPVGHQSSTLEAFTRETRQKVEYYRKQLGHRLNRDRVNVEILNARMAPKLDRTVVPKVDGSMMRGVPMMQENYVDQNYGSQMKLDPMPVDHPDARIQYGLQEEQLREEYDRRVQQEYMREFVENARRDGVRVVLDKEGNVVHVEALDGGRTPGSYEGSSR